MNLLQLSKLILAAAVLLPISACVPFAAAGTAVVGTTIAEERSVGDKIDDNIIEIKVKEAYLQNETSEMFERISVNAIEGRVLLTGSVKSVQYRIGAEELAWKISGVKEVINEIVIDKKELSDHAKDMWIASAVRSKLLFEKDLRSINYLVDVNNGTVFLLGLAQDEGELNRAIKIASTVKGVKNVVNHVILVDDPRRNASNWNKKKEM